MRYHGYLPSLLDEYNTGLDHSEISQSISCWINITNWLPCREDQGSSTEFDTESIVCDVDICVPMNKHNEARARYPDLFPHSKDEQIKTIQYIIEVKHVLGVLPIGFCLPHAVADLYLYGL